MKTKRLFFAPGIAALGLTTIACIPAAARPPQAASQETAPPPPPPAYAPAVAPSPDGPPPPPPRRERRPGPPPPPAACGPDAPPPQRASAYPQAPASTVRGSIRQFNYGPEGEVSGLLLSNGVLVSFPPETGEQIATVAKVKSEVIIAGYQRQSATGKTILDAFTITAEGQTIAVPVGPAGPRNAPPPPPPPPSNGAEPGQPQN
jgi:hypothetical protein